MVLYSTVRPWQRHPTAGNTQQFPKKAYYYQRSMRSSPAGYVAIVWSVACRQATLPTQVENNDCRLFIGWDDALKFQDHRMIRTPCVNSISNAFGRDGRAVILAWGKNETRPYTQ